MKRFLSFVLLSGIVGFAYADNNSTDPPRYEVNLILENQVTPTIDGVISEGEWDHAAGPAGDWVTLGGAPDTHNLRFRMLWDTENLYLLGETDFTGFAIPTDDFEDPDPGQTYIPTIILDPNKGGEDLAARSNETADGYHIAWSMDQGRTGRMPTPGDPERALRDVKDEQGNFLNDYIPGLLMEANVNALSGNSGGWDQADDGPNQNYRDDAHPGIVFFQTADNANVNESGSGGGVFELSVAWSNLNATDPNRLLSEADGDLVDPESELFIGAVGDPDPRFSDPESELFLGNGLYAVEGPSVDDVWAFEIGAVTQDSENSMPSWSQPQGGDPTRDSLTAWGASGHGRLVFLGKPQDPLDPLDCNADGSVDTLDLECVTSETLNDTLTRLEILAGDFNGDKEVAFSDFLKLNDNFGKNEGVNYTLGDANADGEVAFADFLILNDNFGKTPGGDPDPVDPLDCNQDGSVDTLDLECVTSATLGDTLARLEILAGDFNGDKEVAFSDFLKLNDNFGKSEGINYTLGDANADGEVAFADFLILNDNFGKRVGGAESSAAAVPEPGGYALLLIGILALLHRRR